MTSGPGAVLPEATRETEVYFLFGVRAARPDPSSHSGKNAHSLPREKTQAANGPCIPGTFSMAGIPIFVGCSLVDYLPWSLIDRPEGGKRRREARRTQSLHSYYTRIDCFCQRLIARSQTLRFSSFGNFNNS